MPIIQLSIALEHMFLSLAEDVLSETLSLEITIDFDSSQDLHRSLDRLW